MTKPLRSSDGGRLRVTARLKAGLAMIVCCTPKSRIRLAFTASAAATESVSASWRGKGSGPPLRNEINARNTAWKPR